MLVDRKIEKTISDCFKYFCKQNNKRSNYLPYLFSDYINGIGYQTVNSLSKKKRPIDSDDIFLMKFVKDAKEIVVDRKVKEMQQLNLLIKKRHAVSCLRRFELCGFPLTP